MTTCIKPGQLVRITRSFPTFEPNTLKLVRNLKPNEVVLLVAVKKDELGSYEDYTTTMLSSTGEILMTKWFRAPFDPFNGGLGRMYAEPIEIT